MANEIYASVRVTLPDGPADMANALGEIATAWATFLAVLDQSNSVVSLTVNETRSRAPATGAKRGRKPRLVLGDVTPRGLMGPEEAA